MNIFTPTEITFHVVQNANIYINIPELDIKKDKYDKENEVLELAKNYENIQKEIKKLETKLEKCKQNTNFSDYMDEAGNYIKHGYNIVKSYFRDSSYHPNDKTTNPKIKEQQEIQTRIKQLNYELVKLRENNTSLQKQIGNI